MSAGKPCSQCGCQFVGHNVCRAKGEPSEFLRGLAVMRAYHELHQKTHASGGNPKWAQIHADALKVVEYCAELHRKNVEADADPTSGPGWMGHATATVAHRLLTMLAASEETANADRFPDDPEADCVFVDMRHAEFETLIRDAATALAPQS